MSTRIHNGYRLEGVNSLKSMHEFATEVAGKIREKQKAVSIGLAARYLTLEHDLAYAEGQGLVEWEARPIRVEENSSLLGRVCRWCSDQMVRAEKSHERDPEFDLAASFTFLPEALFLNGETVIPALFYCEQKSYREIWESMPQVHDMHFQNQSDPDPSVSTEEWEIREKIWDEALPHLSTPAETGFSMNLSTRAGWVYTEDEFKRILKEVPKFSRRVETLARQIASDEKAKEYLAGRETNQLPMHELMKMSHEIASWLHANLQDILEEKRPIIEAFLPKEITLEVALNPLQPPRIEEDEEDGDENNETETEENGSSGLPG